MFRSSEAAGVDLALIKKVHERRCLAAPIDERRRLGALFIDRAIREHLAAALGDEGSLTAASLARTGPRVDATDTHAALLHLARISSAHPASAAAQEHALDVDLATKALGRALDHLRDGELLAVSTWIGKALLALAREPDDEVCAQVEDMGGLTDA